MSRLRTGELMVVAGGAALTVLLFLNWFGAEAAHVNGSDQLATAIRKASQDYAAGLSKTGWSGLGWFVDVLLIVTLLLAAGLLVATVTAAPPAVAVGSAVMTALVGTLTLAITFLRVLFQPDLGLDLPNSAVTVKAPAYVGVLALAVLVVGAWRALADERTDAPESVYTPPPARPVPDA